MKLIGCYCHQCKAKKIMTSTEFITEGWVDIIDVHNNNYIYCGECRNLGCVPHLVITNFESLMGKLHAEVEVSEPINSKRVCRVCGEVSHEESPMNWYSISDNGVTYHGCPNHAKEAYRMFLEEVMNND